MLVCRLTVNLSGGIIEMATGVSPSICSLTKADIAMSGRPAGGRGVTKISIRKLLFVPSIILLTLKVDISPLVPARTPISMKTSAPHELMGPKARLWLSKPTRTSSCSSEQESFSWPSQSAALLRPHRTSGESVIVIKEESVKAVWRSSNYRLT